VFSVCLDLGANQGFSSLITAVCYSAHSKNSLDHICDLECNANQSGNVWPTWLWKSTIIPFGLLIRLPVVLRVIMFKSPAVVKLISMRKLSNSPSTHVP